QPSGAFRKTTVTVCDFCPAGTTTVLTPVGLKSVPEPDAGSKELLGDNCQKTFSPPLFAASIRPIENVSVSPSFGSGEKECFKGARATKVGVVAPPRISADPSACL